MSFKAMNINKLTCLVVFFLASNNIGTEGVIGVNWGRQNAQRLVPSMVVDLLLQNNVHHARIFTSQEDQIYAFYGSGINLTIGVYNMDDFYTETSAKAWVKEKAPLFRPSNARRVFLGLGNAFIGGINGTFNKTTVDIAMNAINFTQKALNAAGHGENIKVNLAQPFNLINNITKPSDAEFRAELKPDLLRFLSFIRDNNEPFCLDLFPISLVEYLNIPDNEFAFPDKKSKYVVKDVNGTVYTDVVMFAYDSFAWALEKLGFPDMKIVISQIGWPTDGYPGANVSNAERFYKGLLPFVASGKGSPKRPNLPIDVFVHTLMDENKNPASVPSSRHWGIFRSNGEPKYKIDLSGQGRDIYPVRAMGIMRMPERWCVVDETAVADRGDTRMEEAHEAACAEADCTCTFTGGSCSGLSRMQNASYAFNMLFQQYFQDETKCNHDGLSKVVTTNPSTGTCVFPVEVVRGEQNIL